MVSVSASTPRRDDHAPATLPRRRQGWGGSAAARGSRSATAPSGRSTRTDGADRPAHGRVVATVKAAAGRLAAGARGRVVPAPRKRRVSRIDPAGTASGRRSRRRQRAGHRGRRRRGVGHRASRGPVVADRSGRIRYADRSTSAGVSYSPTGRRAVGGNFVTGVSRIDPRTNRVTAGPVGAVQALAPQAGAAWASTAGAARDGTLPAPACSPSRAAARPTSLSPPTSRSRARRAPVARRCRRDPARASAPRLPRGTLQRRLRSCDDVDRAERHLGARRCAANANAYAHAGWSR